MNYIATTTIYEPSIALKKYIEMKDWTVVVAGDKKTPHELYKELNCIYLTPEMQADLYPEISETIGWNCIQRRNLAVKYAYDQGAEVIALIDDDNIPLENWGKIQLGTQQVNQYQTKDLAFDPIGIFYPHLWHRGFPLELVKERMFYTLNHAVYNHVKEIDIQANLWNGDPDIDAICRMMSPEHYVFNNIQNFTSNKFSPFNSQNTLISRNVVPHYMCIPYIGRMDDIWGGYYAQACGHKVMYSEATVFQDRNDHDITKDYKQEVIGYENTYNLLQSLYESPETIYEYLPEKAALALRTWLRSF